MRKHNGDEAAPASSRTAAGAWQVFLFLLVAAAAAAEGAGTLTIATYNVGNYNFSHRMVDGAYRPEYPKPEAEKAALRRVLRDLQADVLALQEIGGSDFLRELQRDLRIEGCEYPFAAVLERGEEPRFVAVLSRRPLLAQEAHGDLRYAYLGGTEPVRRGMLEVQVGVGPQRVTLFVVHLKSRYTERADDPLAARMRAAEAVVLRDRVLQRVAAIGSELYVIAGDFNAHPRDRPVVAFLQRGKTRISELVPVADSRGDRWTQYYAREDSYSRVDHLLVSPALFPHIVDAGGRIHDGAGVQSASDHRPVVVTIALPERQAAK